MYYEVQIEMSASLRVILKSILTWWKEHWIWVRRSHSSKSHLKYKEPLYVCQNSSICSLERMQYTACKLGLSKYILKNLRNNSALFIMKITHSLLKTQKSRHTDINTNHNISTMRWSHIYFLLYLFWWLWGRLMLSCVLGALITTDPCKAFRLHPSHTPSTVSLLCLKYTYRIYFDLYHLCKICTVICACTCFSSIDICYCL